MRVLSICFTDGGVSSHIVAIVKADKGQVGNVRGKGQDEQDSHHIGHIRPPQAQCSDEGGGGDSKNRNYRQMYVFLHYL